MENNKEYIDELFALPINLKLVARVEGTPLYSNDKLKKKYIKSLEKRPETKKVFKEFEKLVNEGYIIPCWLNKGITRFIAYKIFAPFSSKGILGFFHPDSKKFYIIIDNNISIGLASDTMIAKLTLHESMHMLAHKNPGRFIKTFESEIEKWYYHLFIELFDLDTSKIPKNIKFSEPSKFLFRNIEVKMNVSKSVFDKYEKMVSKLCKPYSKLNSEDFDQRLKELILLPKIYYDNVDNFLSIIKKYKHIIQPMYKAYDHAFGIRDLSTLCIQELLYPSEVISIVAESKPNSKIYQGIKQI